MIKHSLFGLALVACLSAAPSQALAGDEVTYTMCSFQRLADNGGISPGDVWIGSQPFSWDEWWELTEKQRRAALDEFAAHILPVAGKTGGQPSSSNITCNGDTEDRDTAEEAHAAVARTAQSRVRMFQEEGAKGIISDWSPSGLGTGPAVAQQEAADRAAEIARREEAARQNEIKNQQIQAQAARDMAAARAKRAKFLEDLKAREAECKAQGRTTCPGVGSDQ